MLSVLAALAFSVKDVGLERLTEISDRIVVARVTEVAAFHRGVRPSSRSFNAHGSRWATKDTFHVARAEVMRSIKGPEREAAVFFVATSTWTCDVSKAEQGETVLLFLSHTTLLNGESPSMTSRVDAFRGTSPVFQIAWHGRGRMPIDVEDGRPFVTSWNDVTMPSPLQLHAEKASSFFRAPLDELEACIGAYLAIGNEPLVHAFYRWDADAARDWDLRVGRDGSAVARYYARGSNRSNDPTVERRPSEEWVGRLDPESLSNITASVRVHGAAAPPEIVGNIALGEEERIFTLFHPFPGDERGRLDTTTRLFGRRDLDAKLTPDVESAWTVWEQTERLAQRLTASLGRDAKPK